jgi:uncharacterized membrane protein YjjP (DUF1212 family)
MGSVPGRVFRRLLREWKSVIFWMAVQWAVAYGMGAAAFHLLQRHGVSHPYVTAAMLGFVGYTLVVVARAWYEETQSRQEEPARGAGKGAA